MVDPGTTGSTGQGCIGRQDQFITVYPSTPITFPGSVPANDTEFCYEGASIDLITSQGSPPPTGTVAFSGFGISDNGNGTAKFTPKTAFDQKNFGSLNPETVTITATYTNAQGCNYTIDRDFIIRPKPNSVVLDPGNNPVTDNNFCYSDASLTLIGNTGTSVQYDIDYVSLGYTQTINSNTFDFDPGVFFDDFVAQGGSNVSDATFNIKYIVTDAIGCSATSSRTFAVSPLATITISGINDGDLLCENVQPFPITFAPINGTLEVNGAPTGLNPTTNSISSIQLPIGDAVTIEYEYLSGVSQCPTTKLYTISNIAAPTAAFIAPPICDGDPATFTAGPDPDNYTWKWVLGDSIRSGTGNQSINHVFPGLSPGATQTSYLIRLIVENTPTALKVCRDSTEAIQVVGAYPNVDFDYSDVCENDFTRFTISSNIPIATAEWDFGYGGFTLADNPLNATIPGGTHLNQTQGIYGQPEHRFSSPSRYNVELIGRTASSVGACANTITRQVAILEKLIPTRATPYDMSTANGVGGDGFWVEEDRGGFSTWEFGAPTGKDSITNTVGNVWITNTLGDYLAIDNSFVNSPCFDLSDFTKPVFSIQYWNNTDGGKDGAILQYSTNGGFTWQEVGTPTSGTNWYSNTTISSAPGGHNQFGWTGRSQRQWLTGKNSLDAVAGNPNVRFRIAFASDEREEYDGFAFNNVVIEERNRIMLVEHFSNINSSNNPDITESNSEYNSDPELNDAEIVKIQYHTSYPDADPINSLNPADHNARAAYYGVTSQSIPLGLIDGDRDDPFGFITPPNVEWWDDFKQKRSLSSSPYTLQVQTEPSVSTEELTIHVTGARIAPVPGNKPVLHVVVIEKDEAGNENVVRKLLPNASGTPLDPSALSIDQTFVWVPRGLTDLADLAVVAFIQDEVTKEIHQSDIDLNNTNNPTSVVTGIEDPAYTEKINLFPNPANHVLNIELPGVVNRETPVVMFDTYGRAVYQSAFKEGEYHKTVNTTELTGGVYIVQIGTPEGGIARRKVMVVHR